MNRKRKSEIPDVVFTRFAPGFFSIAGETRRGARWMRDHVPSQERGHAYCDDTKCAIYIFQAVLRDGLTAKGQIA